MQVDGGVQVLENLCSRHEFNINGSTTVYGQKKEEEVLQSDVRLLQKALK